MDSIFHPDIEFVTDLLLFDNFINCKTYQIGYTRVIKQNQIACWLCLNYSLFSILKLEI